MSRSQDIENPKSSLRMPIIFGQTLDWHKVQRERQDKTIAPYQRIASVFRANTNSIQLHIEAEATNTKVILSPPKDPYIGFKAEIIYTPQGHCLVEFTAQLKYPPEAGPLLAGTRYEGMPRLSQLTPGVKDYFESCLGRKIDGVLAIWDDDPRSENYEKYMQAKGHQPHSPELARTLPAGVIAQDLGFTGEVVVRDGFHGSRRNIPCVIVHYYRPGIVIPKVA